MKIYLTNINKWTIQWKNFKKTATISQVTVSKENWNGLSVHGHPLLKTTKQGFCRQVATHGQRESMHHDDRVPVTSNSLGLGTM